MFVSFFRCILQCMYRLSVRFQQIITTNVMSIRSYTLYIIKFIPLSDHMSSKLVYTLLLTNLFYIYIEPK